MKQKLLDVIDAGRDREESELLPQVNDDPPERPGAWTAKDQLAHLANWREVNAVELDASRTGGQAPDISDDDDFENAKVYERTHLLPAATIRKAGNDSWNQLAAAVERCSEEDLAKPRHPDRPELNWQLIASNAYIHLAEHLGYIHAERRDEAAAESVARWAFDLATSTFPDDRGRGAATYNLGCFYAKRGRAEEAMPYLRRGIELRPDLREWAKQDTDLDPIRSTPELVSLLA